MVQFLKSHAPLESVLVHLVVLSLVAVWLALRPSSRTPLRVLVGLLILYAGLSTRLGVEVLSFPLTRGLTSIERREDARGADTIVVLGSGAQTYRVGGVVFGLPTEGSTLRSLEGARVCKLLDARLVIASGGIPYPEFTLKPESEMMRGVLVAAGVPPDRILEESQSRTTVDEARILAPMLRARGATRFVLVTSPTHMRRSLAAFRHEGLDPVPSVAPTRSEHLDPPPLLMPSDAARYMSDAALYDYAGTVYNWMHR